MTGLWLQEGHHRCRPYPGSAMTESTLNPWPLAAWFFKPFNSIPAPFLLEGWRENFLGIEGQASNWKIYSGDWGLDTQVWKSLLNSCPKCFCCYFSPPGFHKIQSGILHPGTFWFDHSGPRRRGKEQRVVFLHTSSSWPLPSSSDQMPVVYFLPSWGREWSKRVVALLGGLWGGLKTMHSGICCIFSQ